jgi:hypothetical protein
MKTTRILYKLWLSIIATNVCNLSLILFNTRLRLKKLLKTYNNHLQQTTNPKLQSKLTVADIPAEFGLNKTDSQLEKVRKKNIVKVAIVGDVAYWVHNNTFYRSNIINGYIDNEGAIPIDAHSLSKKELDNLLKVLDNII